METFDCIVVGVGGFGSGAFYHLAKRGLRVLGIEQFGIAHDRGSSHGQTRIIRKAYFEHPNYVPLAIRAYDLWRELEAESGQDLMRLSGVVLAGPPHGQAVAGAKTSAQQHELVLEELTSREAKARFPGLNFPEEFSVAHEPDAGYLRVEPCVETHIKEAQKHGGILKTDETVVDWFSDGQTVSVRTNRQYYQAGGLIITAGPWAVKLLSDLRLPLQVLRKPVFWSAVHAEFQKSLPQWPGFLFELPEGVFYGLPGADGASLKIAEHTGGQIVEHPHQVNRQILPEDQRNVERFLTQCVPAAKLEFQKHNVCLYTMSPDGHFLIDRHPGYDNVVFGAGFSGHGFKFTSVLGQTLSDLVLHGSTPLPVDFLSLARLGLREGA